MNLRTIVAAAALAVAGLMAGTSVAAAADAAATTTLNVRSGPGTGFGVVSTLQRGQIVELLDCNRSPGWCLIDDRGRQGWASSRFLEEVPSGRPGGGRLVGPVSPGPDVGVSINTPGFNLQIGTPGARPQPGRPIRAAEVCFFEEYNFRGRSFCARQGERANRLDRYWDSRIRSVSIEGRVTAEVCDLPNNRGRCVTIDSSVGNLGRMADSIASYQIYR